jgi:hypothetical protein
MDIVDIGCEGVDWIQLASDWVQRVCCEPGNKSSVFMKGGEPLHQLNNYQLFVELVIPESHCVRTSWFRAANALVQRCIYWRQKCDVKATLSGVEVKLHVFLTSTLHEGQIHAPAVLPPAPTG